jgi:hypothetical protein
MSSNGKSGNPMIALLREYLGTTRSLTCRGRRYRRPL